MNSGELLRVTWSNEVVSVFLHVIIYIIQVFDGNNDEDTVKSHNLNPPITARYIRFRPIEWHVWIAMRVELYGCLQGKEGRCSNLMLTLSKIEGTSPDEILTSILS